MQPHKVLLDSTTHSEASWPGFLPAQAGFCGHEAASGGRCVRYLRRLARQRCVGIRHPRKRRQTDPLAIRSAEVSDCSSALAVADNHCSQTLIRRSRRVIPVNGCSILPGHLLLGRWQPTTNSQPPSARFDTDTPPPCRRAIPRTNVRPSPVLWNVVARSGTRRTDQRLCQGIRRGSRGPRSRTLTLMSSFCVTVTLTVSPEGECRIAFLSRFENISRNNGPSPVTVRLRFSCRCHRKDWYHPDRSLLSQRIAAFNRIGNGFVNGNVVGPGHRKPRLRARKGQEGCQPSGPRFGLRPERLQ